MKHLSEQAGRRDLARTPRGRPRAGGGTGFAPFDAGVNPSTGNGAAGLVEVHQANNVSTGYTQLWYSVGTPQCPTNSQSVSSVVNWTRAINYDAGVQSVGHQRWHRARRFGVFSLRQPSSGRGSSGERRQPEFTGGAVVPRRHPVWWLILQLRPDRLGASHLYDGGLNPSGAMGDLGDGSVVELHQGQGDALWYHVGKASLSSDTISWGPSRQFDRGYHPNVAVSFSGNTVVEVHQASQADPSALWYSVGTLQPQTMAISWGPDYHYDNGSSPAISFGGSGVKEVHQGAPGAVWTDIGTLSGSTINFVRPQNYGNYPGTGGPTAGFA